jgi:hypothetical protein
MVREPQTMAGENAHGILRQNKMDIVPEHEKF